MCRRLPNVMCSVHGVACETYAAISMSRSFSQPMSVCVCACRTLAIWSDMVSNGSDLRLCTEQNNTCTQCTYVAASAECTHQRELYWTTTPLHTHHTSYSHCHTCEYLCAHIQYKHTVGESSLPRSLDEPAAYPCPPPNTTFVLHSTPTKASNGLAHRQLLRQVSPIQIHK